MKISKLLFIPIVGLFFLVSPLVAHDQTLQVENEYQVGTDIFHQKAGK